MNFGLFVRWILQYKTISVVDQRLGLLDELCKFFGVDHFITNSIERVTLQDFTINMKFAKNAPRADKKTLRYAFSSVVSDNVDTC